MVVGEVAASAMAMEEDKREDEEQEKKDAAVDYSKLEADIEANKILAAQVLVANDSLPGDLAATLFASAGIHRHNSQPPSFPILFSFRPSMDWQQCSSVLLVLFVISAAAQSLLLPFCFAKGSVADALEGLLNLEKVQRLAENSRSTKMCCTAILETCFNAKDWKLLNEHIILLAKRRSQLKQANRPGSALIRLASRHVEQYSH